MGLVDGVVMSNPKTGTGRSFTQLISNVRSRCLPAQIVNDTSLVSATFVNISPCAVGWRLLIVRERNGEGSFRATIATEIIILERYSSSPKI